MPFEPAAILERIEAHPEPRSLLALVETGRASGFAVDAFEAAWEDLASIRLPAIVHLRDPESGDSAFAVLVELEPDAVIVENPASRVETRLSRDVFSGLWSGVLVTIARGERGLTPFPEGKGVRPLSVGSEPHAWARVTALVLIAAFALVGGLRGGAIGVLFAGLTLAGTVIGALLLSGSRKTQVASAGFKLASALCKRGTLTDCEGVLSSKWARIGPFELATWGFAFFASCALMFALRAPLPWLAGVALLASPLSIFLIGVQLGPLKRICTLCMSIHAIVLAGAIAGLVAYSPTQAVSAAFPWALVHAAAFLVSLGVLAPYIEMEIENRTHRARLDWIGTTPWGALAEYAGRPPADLGLISTAHLGGADARFRLDVLVHVTCKGCPPLLEKLERLARRHQDLVRVDLHFPSRDTNVPEDGELCVAFAAIGATAGGEQLLRVFDLVKQDPWKRMATAKAGAPAVLTEFLPSSEPAAIEGARRSVDAATKALDLLKRGTPQLVLAGRPWDGSIEDLESLIVRHPDALEEAMA
ncbi:MAG TPA: vitamin K epoxide reductase family protein [Candidatus Polarisedimenticolaceae bacterium]|nr:vitamin K epoxide reductase family protein [Candidatus Polarisedimenticolaceae bacterium]